MENESKITKLKDSEMINSEFVSEAEAAEIIGRSEGTLRNWRVADRFLKEIPTFTFRRAIFYRRADVLAFSPERQKNEYIYPRCEVLFSDKDFPSFSSTHDFSTDALAEVFGLSSASLKIWRSKGLYGDVLPFDTDPSGRISYSFKNIEAFINGGRKYFKEIQAGGKAVNPRRKIQAQAA